MGTAGAGVGGARRDGWAPPPASGHASGIRFEKVTVAYRGQAVLSDFSLTVEPGEVLAIIGPSGSGKTTALRAVAGFVNPSAGVICIGERDVTNLPPHARGIGMVVQNYALFPHMRVRENVAFGLQARRTRPELVEERVIECLRMVGMTDFLHRYPRELSGGQQQRVAIARAIAIRPQVLLLDEPLSALDAQIRRNMLEELTRLHRELPSLTILYVTHDQTEALTLAGRIAILRDGRLVAEGASQSLYRTPPNRFTAEFLGRANLVPVRIERITAGARYAQVRFADALLWAQRPSDMADGEACLLCIRPHDLFLTPSSETANSLAGTVKSVVWQGDQHSISLQMQAAELRLVSAPIATPPEPGEPLRVHFEARSATLIPHDGGRPS